MSCVTTEFKCILLLNFNNHQHYKTVAMLPLAFGVPLLSFGALFGRDHLSRAAYSMSVSLCQPYKRSPRYKQMVAYYQWKLEDRYQRNLVFKGFELCHDAFVAWCLVYQLLRLVQLAEGIFGALK